MGGRFPLIRYDDEGNPRMGAGRYVMVIAATVTVALLVRLARGSRLRAAQDDTLHRMQVQQHGNREARGTVAHGKAADRFIGHEEPVTPR